MNKPKATAVWEGSGKTGKGKLNTFSGVLKDTPYTFKTRFEGAPGTNPEELLAAAHAGCFTMKLAFNIDAAGFTASRLDTTCLITFEDGTIKASDLKVEAEIPGITQEAFQQLLADAEKTCPVSQLFNAKISAEGILK